MTLEVIATTVADAKAAEKYGADRLELSPGMLELGITTSYGLIESVVRSVTIPYNAIIRPHSQSVIYDRDDVNVMINDIQIVKKWKGNGIVIGPLTRDDVVDEETLKYLLDAAGDLDVTFHKAFDFARDQIEALECLAEYPKVNRIATSGGLQSAVEVPDKINGLIQIAKQTHLKIMVAGGLRVDNFEAFYDKVKADEVHFGSGIRTQGSYLKSIDPNKVAAIKRVLG